MQLHEELGPRATTISAIAERAGVQRLTVYRHFPDESAIFQTCTSHWLELNPLPDPASWAGIAGPDTRLRIALLAFYDYYARTRRMWEAAHRDAEHVPALQAPMADVRGFLESVGDDLATAYSAKGERGPRLSATIHHALAFPAWVSLEEGGLSNASKADLVGRWVSGA